MYHNSLKSQVKGKTVFKQLKVAAWQLKVASGNTVSQQLKQIPKRTGTEEMSVCFSWGKHFWSQAV